MPNRNYEAGRRFEYKLIKQLEEEGARFVTRGAGSHGGDIVAIFFDDVMYIEAKKTQQWPPPLYEEEREKIAQKAKHVCGLNVDFWFVIQCNRKGVIWLKFWHCLGTYGWICDEDRTTISTETLADVRWLGKAERIYNA